jgi:hypothetical protein
MGRGGGGNGSFFEYNITRPFPFKHFTLIAVVLGILWLAIVTVINVLSQGYILVTTYSTDWTGLEAAGRSEWYASIISKTRSSCQPKLFEVGDSFRSNSSGLMYIVSGFRYATSCQANESAPPDATGDIAGFPGLVYSNELLQGCSVDSISILADSSNSFTPIAYVCILVKMS